MPKDNQDYGFKIHKYENDPFYIPPGEDVIELAESTPDFKCFGKTLLLNLNFVEWMYYNNEAQFVRIETGNTSGPITINADDPAYEDLVAFITE